MQLLTLLHDMIFEKHVKEPSFCSSTQPGASARILKWPVIFERVLIQNGLKWSQRAKFV